MKHTIAQQNLKMSRSPPACLNVLNQTTTQENVTTFDNGNGQIYIVESIECWTQILDAIDDDLVKTQENVELLRQLHVDTTAVEQRLAELEIDREYANGVMVFSRWQWDESQMVKGDVAGMCYWQPSQTEDNSASCWGFTATDDGYAKGNSYLFKPSSVTEDTNLDDMEQA